jgi:itaconate CoA-transferase
MNRHGYLTFGTGNDYSSKFARSAKRRIVEVDEKIPRVGGGGAARHMPTEPKRRL